MNDKDQSAGLIIRLDVGAMNALFPEGTTARVELQQAVLANASKRFVKGQLDDGMRTYLKQVVGDCLKDIKYDAIVAELFDQVKGKFNSSLRIKDGGQLEQALKVAAEDFFRDNVNELLETKVEEIRTRYLDTLDARLTRALEQTLSTTEQKEFTRRVNERMKSFLEGDKTQTELPKP